MGEEYQVDRYLEMAQQLLKQHWIPLKEKQAFGSEGVIPTGSVIRKARLQKRSNGREQVFYIQEGNKAAAYYIYEKENGVGFQGARCLKLAK